MASTDDDINCDDAQTVGEKIQEGLNGVCVQDAKIKRSNQVKTLDDLLPGVKINGKKVNIDPAILFTRLTALAQSDENMQYHFKYELTHEPTALFKEGSMRKPRKSKLRQHLLDINILLRTTVK